jgi:hypothetical protein
MDHIEKAARAPRRGKYANQSEVTEQDFPLPATPIGREPGSTDEVTSIIDEEIRAKSVGSPRADGTDYRDPGSDAEETPDGLTASEESVRHAAEDAPTGADPNRPMENVPVFDRASLPPKI